MTQKKAAKKPSIHPGGKEAEARKKAAKTTKHMKNYGGKVPAPTEESPEQYGRAMDEIIQYGDLASLTTPQRSEFLWKLALSMGLSPMSQPFELITLNGKLTIYAKRTAADQLRQKHKITSEVISEGPLMIGEQPRDDVYCVKVKLFGKDKDGNPRSEYAIGCVGIGGLNDEALANAIMKCHTKALRRGTLSFCGLGFLDEIEVASVQEAAASPGVGSPRRMIPRITPSPQPAGGTAKPIIIPGVEIPNDPATPKDANKKVETTPTVLPPVKPPISIPKGE
jgi:hypothetical protein